MADALWREMVRQLTDCPNAQVVLFCAILVLTCLLGDRLCAAATSQPSLVWRAMADSATHGAVGLVSWAVVVSPGLRAGRWLQCALCGALASLIDLDHFVQARSLHLQMALSLQHRPFSHATSLALAVAGFVWVVSLALRQPFLRVGALMCVVAWLSHHLRDATRRGLWLPPLGSSPPLPYAVYVSATVVLAVVARWWYSSASWVLLSPPAVGSEGVSAPSVLVQ